MSNPSLFAGVALVTGAASGIGRQIAISFAHEACTRIALLDRDQDGLSETARLCKTQTASVRTFIVPFDVRAESEVGAAIELVVEEWGRLDYAVNCAGILGASIPSHCMSAVEFDAVNHINYRGLWLCARAEISQMMSQEPMGTHDGRPGNKGAIVHVASNLGLVSKPSSPAYNASKAAVISLARSDALDYSEHNIRINCVCPGVIDTPMTEAMPNDHPNVLMASLRRKGSTQEVADAVLFLCSSKATYIQGQALCVDGGYTIH